MPARGTSGRSSRLRAALVAAALTLTPACGSSITAHPAPSSATGDPTARALAGQVSDAGALVHLQALQGIADQHGGNRATGNPGYDASVDYVAGVLRAAGLEVTTPTYQHSPEDGDDDEDASPKPGAATARNVIAQTRTGDPAHVVMVGAHLDSVPEGPGVVDDGSGVATLLEIATRLAGSPPVRNTVRFAFFGSEEVGSQGSKAYLHGLTPADRSKIMLYLNVDMVASPNAGYFVQGGTGDDRSETGAPGSKAVGDVLNGQLAATGVTTERIPFAGDDETAFIEAGIPTGGAENGDAEKKTAEQATAWGGHAGQVYDPCYHSACDGVSNVNRDVLNHYLRAVAGTVGYFAATGTPPTP